MRQHPCAPGILPRVLVLESLRSWARNTGVDGFRFDLASIFSRAVGTMSTHEAALVAEIGLLARLFHVRLVAEAWDISSYGLPSKKDCGPTQARARLTPVPSAH